MQEDFHYYATYCAACIAGYTHEDSTLIARASQFVDCCSRTLLKKAKAPLSACTTQLQGELIDARLDPFGLQDVTQIWASFHFLPKDLYAPVKALSKSYRNKYRLICGPNSDLIVKTIQLAKDKDLESIGLAMHILADTWAHTYFAGTPSQVINNINFNFNEIFECDGKITEKPVTFVHKLNFEDDLETSTYVNSVNNGNENFIMNLGHGRAGHLPDYSFIKYRYTPAWGNYKYIIKDNPSDYYHAFGQMIYALKYLKGDIAQFNVEQYDFDSISKYSDQIKSILNKRQLDSSDDWKSFGYTLSNQEIEPYSTEECYESYLQADKKKKDDTFLGRFTLAALRQKSMVTKEIFKSGNLLAGISVDYNLHGFKGIKDFQKLIEQKEDSNE